MNPDFIFCSSFVLLLVHKITTGTPSFISILKNHETITEINSIRMHINKLDNKMSINPYKCLDNITCKTIKLLGSTKSKVTKNKSGENVPLFETAEVVFIHCSIVNNDYQQDKFVPNKSFSQSLDISPIFYSLKLFTQNFHILKYGLLIKILNHLR